MGSVIGELKNREHNKDETKPLDGEVDDNEKVSRSPTTALTRKSDSSFPRKEAPKSPRLKAKAPPLSRHSANPRVQPRLPPGLKGKKAPNSPSVSRSSNAIPRMAKKTAPPDQKSKSGVMPKVSPMLVPVEDPFDSVIEDSPSDSCCDVCGSSLKANAAFCDECGAKKL